MTIHLFDNWENEVLNIKIDGKQSFNLFKN